MWIRILNRQIPVLYFLSRSTAASSLRVHPINRVRNLSMFIFIVFLSVQVLKSHVPVCIEKEGSVCVRTNKLINWAFAHVASGARRSEHENVSRSVSKLEASQSQNFVRVCGSVLFGEGVEFRRVSRGSRAGRRTNGTEMARKRHGNGVMYACT